MTRLAPSRSKMPVLTQGVLSVAVAILAGCGGGGGGDSTPATPVASVTSAQASAVKADRTLLVTVQGQNLDQGLTASSTGCKAAPVLSTTAPNASTATTAYFTCTAAAAGAQTMVVKRTDGTTLKTVSYTIDPLLPTVSSAVASGIGTDTPRYGQQMLITVNGADLDLGITVASPNCASLTQSTANPFISTSSTAFFTCTPKAIGALQATVKRNSDSGLLTAVDFTVPAPQVTMAVSNGAGVNGNIVFTLAPDKAPITVDNFLKYVNKQFYDGTTFHRVQTNFVVQGGGYAAPIVANTVPTLKTTDPAIALEVGTGLSNTQWTVSMARTNLPNTATSQFFISLKNNASILDSTGLDSKGNQTGYAVFGSVTSGTDVVSSMTTAACTTIANFISSALGCVPIPNVVITSATQTR